MLLETLQHHIVLNRLVAVLVLVVLFLNDADTQNHLLRIVVAEDDA